MTAHDPTATEPGEIRVTARAVGVLYLYRAITGFVVGYPVARTLGALGATSRADGDRDFFAAGGLQLLEALRLGTRLVPAALESATFVGVLVAIGAIFPLALALVALLHPRGTQRGRFGIAADRAPTLLVLGGAAVLVQAGLVVVTAMVVTAISSATGSLRNERTADLVTLFTGGLVGLLMSFAIGVLQDLSRAASVRHGAPAFESVRIAVRTFSAKPRAVLRAFFPPVLGTLALVLGAATLTSTLDVSRPGTWRVVCVGLVHQLVILAVVALRLTALGTALTLTGPHARRRDPYEDVPPEEALTG